MILDDINRILQKGAKEVLPDKSIFLQRIILNIIICSLLTVAIFALSFFFSQIFLPIAIISGISSLIIAQSKLYKNYTLEKTIFKEGLITIMDSDTFAINSFLYQSSISNSFITYKNLLDPEIIEAAIDTKNKEFLAFALNNDPLPISQAIKHLSTNENRDEDITQIILKNALQNFPKEAEILNEIFQNKYQFDQLIAFIEEKEAVSYINIEQDICKEAKILDFIQNDNHRQQIIKHYQNINQSNVFPTDLQVPSRMNSPSKILSRD